MLGARFSSLILNLKVCYPLTLAKGNFTQFYVHSNSSFRVDVNDTVLEYCKQFYIDIT